MFSRQELNKLVFFDVETATEFKNFNELKKNKPRLAELWSNRCIWLRENYSDNKEKTDEELYEYKGALHPEFNRVLCVTFGRVEIDENLKVTSSVKTYSGDDEKQVLKDTLNVFEKFLSTGFRFSGHNIKGFDIPVILKRSIINGLGLPKTLHIHNLKPWEFPFLDTAEVWSFGSWKDGRSSLDLLSTAIGVPTPKEEMNGSMVSDAYWNQGKLKEIVEYCERDVLATANVVLKLGGFSLVSLNKTIPSQVV